MDSKKFLLVMAACFLVLILWQWLGVRIFGQPEPKEQTPEPAKETVPAQPGPEKAPVETAGTGQPAPTQASGKLALGQAQGLRAVSKQMHTLRDDVRLGSRDKGSAYKIEVKLTTDGAGIAEAWLTEFIENSYEYKYSQGAYGQDRQTPVTLLSQVPGRFKPDKAREDLPPCRISLATSRLRFLRMGSKAGTPSREVLATIDLVRPEGQSGQVHWQLAGLDEQNGKASFVATVLLQQDDETLAEVTLRKTYTLAKDSYDIEIELELTLSEGSPSDLAVELVQDGPTGMANESSRGDMRSGIYGVVNVTKGVEKVAVTSIAYAKAADEEGGLALSRGDLLWAGIMNKFFGAYLVPKSSFTSKDDPTAPKVGGIFEQAQIIPIIDPATDKSGNVLTRLVAPTIELQPGHTKTIEMKLFLGPKERKLLKSGEYGRMSFGESIKSQVCCSWMAFAPLSAGLLWLMGRIYWLIPNYGVAIILLVAMVRVALHHFTRTSQMSMMRMSKLAPELEKLKKKYANNREELGRAQMLLYKEHKINPLSGCLPMLLQMPIWFALFAALNTAVELRHAPFFLWINNLSGTDNITAYLAGGLPKEPLFTVPLLGFPIWGLNLLPLLLGVAFFLQQKFTPTAGAAATSSPQAAQTKKMMSFMMWLFPLMLYNAPSGLNLYIMTSTFVGVIESHYIKKHIRQQEEAQNRPIVGGSPDNIKSLKLKKK